MSLLTIVRDAAVRCGIKRMPSEITAAFASTDADLQQLILFATDAGVDCMERADWKNLKIHGQVVGNGTADSFDVPCNFQRMLSVDRYPFRKIVSQTSPAIPVDGPIADQTLQELKAYPGTLAYPVWRLIEDRIEVWPILANGHIFDFWYIAKDWILGADGTRKKQFTADTDTVLINENTIMKGAIWRWKASKGLDYAEAFRDFETSVERNSSQDGAGRVVSLSNNMRLPGNYWPGTIT